METYRHRSTASPACARSTCDDGADPALQLQNFMSMALSDPWVSQGYPRSRSEKAVFHTHNCGVDPAIEWLTEHERDSDIDMIENFPSTSGRLIDHNHTAVGIAAGIQPVMGVPSNLPQVMHLVGHRVPAVVVGVTADCKVILVVNRALKMRVGKIGAQCAHAAVGLYKALVANNVPWLSAWEDAGEKTIVLGGNTTQELEMLAEKASSLSLATYTVRDAGRTQIAAGSTTVLAIGGIAEIVDQVTGTLKLI